MLVDDERLEKARALIEEVRTLQAVLKKAPIPDDTLETFILTSIPFFNGFIKRLNSTTSTISKLIKKTGNAPVSALDSVKVSPFVGISLNILDFLQIPFIYFAAYALGKKPPITLSNNARWLYAAVLLGLCVAAFLVPVAAPVIAIVSAALGFLAATFSMGKLIKRYYSDKKDLKEVMNTINTGPAGLIHKATLKLEAACQDPDNNIELIEQLIVEIESYKQDCEKRFIDINTLYKDANTLKQRQKIELEVMDRFVGITLSSLALCGAVVSIIFPPIGLILLLTTTLAGTAYVVTRFTTNQLIKPQSQVLESINEDNESPSVQQEAVAENSTSKILTRFNSEKNKAPEKNKIKVSNSIPVTEQQFPVEVASLDNAQESKTANPHPR